MHADLYRLQLATEYQVPESVKKRDTPDTVGEVRVWLWTRSPERYSEYQFRERRDMILSLTQLSLKHNRLKPVESWEYERVDDDERPPSEELDRFYTNVKVRNTRTARWHEYAHDKVMGWKAGQSTLGAFFKR